MQKFLPQGIAGGEEVFGEEVRKVLACVNLTDSDAIERLKLQAIKCSADLTVRQLFGWQVSRIADPRLGNVGDRGVRPQEEEDPSSYANRTLTEAQKIKRDKERRALITNGDIVTKCVPCTLKDVPCSDDSFANDACEQCVLTQTKGKGPVTETEEDM